MMLPLRVSAVADEGLLPFRLEKCIAGSHCLSVHQENNPSLSALLSSVCLSVCLPLSCVCVCVCVCLSLSLVFFVVVCD